MVIFSHNSIYYNSIYLLLMPRRDTGHASFLYSSPTFGLAKAPAFIFRLDNNEHYSSFANVSMEFF